MRSVSGVAVAVALALPSIVAAARVPGAPCSLPAEVDAILSATEELLRGDDISISDKVRPQWLGPGRGLGFMAVAPIAKGEVLLAGTVSVSNAMRTDMHHPWESEAFAAFADSMASHFDEMPGRGRLLIKMTHLLLDRNASASSPLERYLRAAAPEMGGFLQWPAHVRELLRGSVLFEAAEVRLEHFRSRARELLQAWPWSHGTEPSEKDLVEAFLKAHETLSTRAFLDTTFGAKLVPVLDIMNHAGPGHANSEYFWNEMDWSVEAMADIPGGEELLMTYRSSEMTYLETWLDYGFFDPSAKLHAAWIDVPLSAAHLQRVYLVPDTLARLESCDLFNELVVEARLKVSDGGQARHYALRRMSELIRDHLAGYPPEEDLEAAAAHRVRLEAIRLGFPPAADLDAQVAVGRDRLDSCRQDARKVVRYEQSLFRRVVKRLDDVLADGQPGEGAP